MKEYLEKLAAESAAIDDSDFNPYNWSGGNLDDAYNQGMDDGYRLLARHLLATYTIPN